MMTQPIPATIATIVLIVLSAFFVIVEFSLLGARRHRLEEDAATSRSARAALRGVNELTMMLAGAQLGITLCTFALGAITKPALDAVLGPLLADLGIPAAVAGTASFLLSLFLVTFLHLVVGEMAPKSYAIAHPEESAKLVAMPARMFVACVRPLLTFANRMANRLVRASGVEPVESAAVGGQDAETIRVLVDHSASSGTLDDSFAGHLTGVLELERLTVRDVLPQIAPTAVLADASVADVQRVALESGHKRILVAPTPSARPSVIHVRETLLEPAGRPVAQLARDAFVLDADLPVYEALGSLRGAGEQLAVVMDGERFAGVLTLADLVNRVLPTVPARR